MGARKRTPAAERLPGLPSVSVARFKEAGYLIERLVSEKQDVFVAAAAAYRAKHREASARPLNAQEAAQVAAAMLSDEDPVTLAARVQESDLRASDEPHPRGLAVAGLATAPALIEAAQELVALLELPNDEFAAARENETLPDAIRAYVEDHLEYEDMLTARPRAQRAFDHFAKAAGQGSSGEAWGLLTKVVGQAFSQAMLTLGPSLVSTSSSLTGSPPSTDGPAATSSTTPDT